MKDSKQTTPNKDLPQVTKNINLSGTYRKAPCVGLVARLARQWRMNRRAKRARSSGDVTKTGNGERGTGNGSLGTSVQR